MIHLVIFFCIQKIFEKFMENNNNSNEKSYNLSRIDRLIKKRYGKNIPQSIIEKAIRNKDITIDNQKIKSSMLVLDDVEIFIHPNILRKFEEFSMEDNNKKIIKIDEKSIAREFANYIIFEDENFVAINKPSGIAVQMGTGMNISIDVMARYYNKNLSLLHRIDRETSGITLLSKNIETSRYMLDLFRSKNIHKKYIAILSNIPRRESGRISKPLSKIKEKVVVDFENGKDSVTDFKILKKNDDIGMCLVSISPQTGRTHQIRVHMDSIGCPVLGDSKYNGKKYKKLCLHAFEMSFRDINHHNICIRADIPDYFPIKL